MSTRFTLPFLLSTLLLGISFGSAAQQAKPAATPQTKKTAASKPSLEDEKRTAEIESFISYAQSVPPEFSADLFLQVVESGELKDAKRKQELLNDAFYAAAKAKEQLKLIPLPGMAVDSREGYRATASALGLNALSLQGRAIKAMLPLDKQRARQLFSELKLKLEPLTCENTLGYDVNSYYTTIQAIAQTSFDAEETNRGEPVFFVEGFVGKITSPNEIPAAVRLILSLQTTDLQLTTLGRAFSAALQKIPADDRSFSAPSNSTLASIGELVKTFRQRELSSDEVLEAYRAYLIKQLGGARCADTATKEQTALENQFVAHFNDTLLRAAYKKIAPISEDEIKPEKREGAAINEAYWKSAKSRAILSQLKKLRFGSQTKELQDQQKQAAEWQSQLSQLLKDLGAWTAEDEKSEEDYFHQKSVAYYALLKTVPPGEQYEGVVDEALRDFASLLSSSPLQKEKPAEWFLHAKVLLDRANNAPPREREKLANLINSLRSTVLHLYLQKQQLLKGQAGDRNTTLKVHQP